jgi:outer membrane protein assembly factor BamB
MHTRREYLAVTTLAPLAALADTLEWPSFRGAGGRGVGDNRPLPESWNADASAGRVSGVIWRSAVPGLGHSSPIICRGRIYVPSAVHTAGSKAPLKVGPNGGASTAAKDDEEQGWVILCYDSALGKQLWRKTARRSQPRVTRHEKATHANTTLATDGEHLVAFFGSEGLYCYDLDGRLLWSRDLGVINISKYGIGWGYGSSPAIHQDHIALVCDDPANPFIAAVRLADGRELWRTSRKGISERSWGTPLIHTDGTSTQVVANGWPWIVSYDLETGRERWRLKSGGDNPIPSPFVANGWIFVTNAHGGKAPIFAIRPGARGDISLAEGATSNDAIVWSNEQGGSYISTPVVYGDYIYLGNTNGVLRCFEAKTGRKMYEERLGADASIYASLVAADGKIFCPSEDGVVYVVKAGGEFKLLARNRMGEPCYATPAVAGGALYFRTTESLIAVGKA